MAEQNKKGYISKQVRVKKGATPIDNKTKFAWSDNDYEEIEEFVPFTEEELAQQAKEAELAEAKASLDALAALIKTTTERSDKVGYSFKCMYIGGICVSKEYVKEESQQGTAESPYEWAHGVQLIPNAYYNYQGKKYVYVGEETTTAGATFDAGNMEEVDW